MNSKGPLEGLRVLELGSMLAGPFVGTMLGDFGAEVIKVEKPGKPDPLREWPPHKGDVSLWWKAMSRNKHTITLDISRPEGQRIARQLIQCCDVVIENFRPGTLERWNLGPDQLRSEAPRVVWVRVSGYGQTGPNSGRGGYATIAECFAGLASVTGTTEGGPMVSAFPLGDYLAGTFGAFGALAALRARDAGGDGQIVDTSLFEPLLRILESVIVRYDQTGIKKPRLGNQMEEDVPRNIYQTLDGGYVGISCGSQRIFENLADAMGQPNLKTDTRFLSMRDRVENRGAIDSIVCKWISTHTTSEALHRLQDHGVVAGKVNEIDEVMADPHVLARRAIVSISDPELGGVRLPGPVPKLSATPGQIRWTGRIAGADNDYVFRDLLGLGSEAIVALQRSGVV